MATQQTENTPSGQHEPDWSPASHLPGGPVGGGSRGVERVEEYARLREECPVAWTDDWGGYWTLTGYDDVRAAARNFQAFASGRPFMQIPDPTEHDGPVPIPISLNPPEHTAYRRALNPFFSAERMADVEPRYREQVVPMIDALIGAGSSEVIWSFCAPAAARGLATLLNLPEHEALELLANLARINELREHEREHAGQDAEREGEAPSRFSDAHVAQVVRIVGERRRQPLDPETDLFSGLLALEVDGGPLPEHALVGMGLMIIGAGHQTTQEAMGNALYLLASNPGDQARLRRDPSLIPAAVEEFIRLGVPTQEHVRRATQDTELHGRTIEAGEYVALNWFAANRDERQFEHASACIIDRSPNRHLGFGHGPHQCLGAPLARLEIRVVLEEILRRTRSISLDGAPEPNRDSNQSGFFSLPLRFEPMVRS